MAQQITLEQEIEAQKETSAPVGKVEAEAVKVEDEYSDLPVVHYVDTPYTTDIILGQGVYIHPLAPYDTVTTRSLQPMTTEPAVALIDGGFRTTSTKYIKVNA